jgi:hypothetical protein
MIDSNGRPRRTIVVDILKRMEMDHLIFLPRKCSATFGNTKITFKVVGPSQGIHGVASHQTMCLALAIVKLSAFSQFQFEPLDTPTLDDSEGSDGQYSASGGKISSIRQTRSSFPRRWESNT